MRSGLRDTRPASARGLPPTPIVLLGVFASGVDNFVAAPMLLAIGAHFGHGLGTAAAVVAAYTLAYGVMQLAWVYASDRFGRLAALQSGLVLGALLTVASALAPNLITLIALRGLAGAGFAAIAPATITFIGDQVPAERRPGALADLVAAYAFGSAAGIVCGGLAADISSWRVGFAASAGVSVLTLAAQLRYRRDPPLRARTLAIFVASVRTTVRSRWPRNVALIALLWGAVLIGFLVFFPAALEEGGTSPRTAGLVVALYGVVIVVASRPARWVAARLPRAVSMALGVMIASAGLAVAAASAAVASIAVATVLVSVGFVLAHPLMQQWATIVIPSERATAVGLFATALFVGTALITQAVAPLADEIGFTWVFGAGAVLGVVLAIVAAAAWTRFERLTGETP